MVKDEDGRARETIDYQGLKVIPGGMGFHRGASEEFLVPNELLDALVKKEWYATGYRVPPLDPGPKREHIPAEWFEFLIFTTDKIVSGGGITFTAVQIQKAERHDDTKRSPRGSVSMGDLRAWMKKRVASLIKAGKRSSARQDEIAAREYFERPIPRNWIAELHDEIAPPEWSKRGRRKKTSN